MLLQLQEQRGFKERGFGPVNFFAEAGDCYGARGSQELSNARRWHGNGAAAAEMDHFPLTFPGQNLFEAVDVHLLIGAAHVTWQQ